MSIYSKYKVNNTSIKKTFYIKRRMHLHCGFAADK